MLTRSVWISSVMLAAGAPVAAAQDDLILDVRLAPLSDVAPAAKDAALHAAFLKLGERLELIPREAGELEPTAEQIRAFWAVATGGVGFQVHIDDDEPLIGFTSVPRVNGEDATRAVMDFIAESAGRDAEVREDGSISLRTPDGTATVTSVRAGEGNAVAFMLGRDEPAPVAVQRGGLPAQASPILSGEFGFGVLIEAAAEEIEDNEPELHEFLDELDLLDATDARMTFAVGNAGDTLHTVMRLENVSDWVDRFIGDSEFARESLRDVPRDATYVAAGVSKLDWLIPVIEMAGEEMDRDFFEFFRDGFGIDLREGVLENLGPAWITYQSDSTGGGGALSTVMIVELADEDAFRRAQDAAMVHANQAGATFGRGYARTKQWEFLGVQIQTLVTPGLPLPLEISWCIDGGKLVAAATPTALLSALDQLRADDSVLDNELFQAAVLTKWAGDERVTAISFRDTPRFAARGYGAASLIASAVANAARKPFDDFWDPGVVMPDFGTFTAGVVPTGSVTTWDGDDVHMTMTSDGSVLVQAATLTSAYGSMSALYAPGMLAGVMLPALGEARSSAQSVKAMTLVRSAVQASIIYHQDTGNAPPNAEALIEIGALTPEMLVSPLGPAWDERGDIVIRSEYNDKGLGSFDPRLVVAIDRAAYISGYDKVSLGFADGRAEQLTTWQVDDYLAMPLNEGVRDQFDLE